MKQIKKSLTAGQKSRTIIKNDAFQMRAKVSQNVFTRKRKLLFEDLMIMISSQIQSSIQTELRRYFKKTSHHEQMSQQAFSKARLKIRHEAFTELFLMTADNFYEDGNFDKYKGYRVLAIDGSEINLPNTDELIKKFGAIGSKANSAAGMASMLYDILNDIIIDAYLEPIKTTERGLAIKHLQQLTQKCDAQKQIIIFDRGYPSEELLTELEKNSFKYIIRVSKSFNPAIDTQEQGDIYYKDLLIKKKPHSVRAVKFILPSGETETLITNLHSDTFAFEDLKYLYGLRWNIESGYDLLKVKLQLENFSGKLPIVIMQDFYSACYMANMAASFAWDADHSSRKPKKNNSTKYEYTVNVNYLISALRDELPAILMESSERKRNMHLSELLNIISKIVVPIRPNRSFPRKPPRQVRFSPSLKPFA